jgi:hypothetical protein
MWDLHPSRYVGTRISSWLYYLLSPTKAEWKICVWIFLLLYHNVRIFLVNKNIWKRQNNDATHEKDLKFQNDQKMTSKTYFYIQGTMSRVYIYANICDLPGKRHVIKIRGLITLGRRLTTGRTYDHKKKK